MKLVQFIPHAVSHLTQQDHIGPQPVAVHLHAPIHMTDRGGGDIAVAGREIAGTVVPALPLLMGDIIMILRLDIVTNIARPKSMITDIAAPAVVLRETLLGNIMITDAEVGSVSDLGTIAGRDHARDLAGEIAALGRTIVRGELIHPVDHIRGGTGGAADPDRAPEIGEGVAALGHIIDPGEVAVAPGTIRGQEDIIVVVAMDIIPIRVHAPRPQCHPSLGSRTRTGEDIDPQTIVHLTSSTSMPSQFLRAFRRCFVLASPSSFPFQLSPQLHATAPGQWRRRLFGRETLSSPKES